MNSYKKAWKLNESLAHSPGIVTTLSFGKRSGRVMATGGDDKEVKLWAVGKPSCILRFRGQTSTPESTEFNSEEDHVAAGSLSGSVKIWNLDSTTLVRSLSGHSSAVRSLHFHQYGNYIVSGSMDTTIKIWDISKKGCINTYRGHTDCVNEVQFSPDGKWLVSASDDCTVKLWCLTTGKLLADLNDHTGPITSIKFHPTNLLLATASLDKTVRIYDLETFTITASSGIELGATPVRKLVFHPDGSCLYCATQDYLKIYNYETMECLETVSIGWRAGGGIVDMAIVPSFNQLVAASLSQGYISTYVVDIKSCYPFLSDDNDTDDFIDDVSDEVMNRIEPVVNYEPKVYDTFATPKSIYVETKAVVSDNNGRPNNLTSVQRKSFCLSGEENKRTVVREDPNSTFNDETESECIFNSPVIDDREEYDRVFCPKRYLNRSPPRNPSNNSTVAEVEKQVLKQTVSDDKSNTQRAAKNDKKMTKSPNIPIQIYTKNGPNNVQTKTNKTPSNNSNITPCIKSQTIDLVNDKTTLENTIPDADTKPPWDSSIDVRDHEPDIVASARSDTLATNLILDSNSKEYKSDIDFLEEIKYSHESFMSVIAGRRQCLESIKNQWNSTNPIKAVECSVAIRDAAVLVDVLSVLNQNSKYWNLDIAKTLLPTLTTLIKSKYKTHVEATCQSLKIVLRHFSALITSTVKGHSMIGVDLYQEQRIQKCKDCLSFLETIRLLLESPDVIEKAGSVGKETRVLFTMLD